MEAVSLKEWWTLAMADKDAAGTAWLDLSPANRKAIRSAVRKAKARLGLLDGEVRELGAKIGEAVEEGEIEDLVNSWPSGGPLSEHIELELAAAFYRGRPLDEGEPVPGCACEYCTGLPADHPARVPAWKRKLQERLEQERRGHDEDDPDRAAEWQRRVEKARAVSITQIAHLLGLGTPEGQGEEVRVRCPFHDDEHPSMRLNAKKQVWFCDPCGEGGNALGLYMRVKEVGFGEAVRELADGILKC